MLSSTSVFRRLLPAVLLALVSLQGCGRFGHHASHEYVYVWLNNGYLINRVSVVNKRVADVSNGERLQVLERGQRFLKVKTAKGTVGWIEQLGVIDQRIYDQFTQMRKDHAHDPVVATGLMIEDYWMRDAPGRQSNRFYWVPENSKVEMLERASVPRPGRPRPVPLVRQDAKVGNPSVPPHPRLEDYWLVRDRAGDVGWVRAATLEVDVPNAILGLAVGRRIVGAYVLRTVHDPDATTPNHQVPEYLTLLSPWKDGLPYDFDEAEVFTWSTKRHRYETAWRHRGIAGYLPASVSRQKFDNREEPGFSFRVASGEPDGIDPQTGFLRYGPTITELYRMQGNIVRREDNNPSSSAHRKHHSRRSRLHGR